MKLSKKIILTIPLCFMFFTATGNVDAHAQSHTVKSGDSLWKIAQKYNTSISNLKSWNGLTSDVIYVNQTLKLSAAPTSSNKTHTVKYGDTLWVISQKYGISISQLKSLNGLTSDVVYPGQTLKLSGTTNTNTPAPAKTVVHTVVSGDTLSKIAGKYGTTVSNIKSLNNLTSNLIFPGQKLQVSGEKADTPKVTQAEKVEQVISEGMKYIGVPYVWGGTSPQGFDCSGFLHYVFLQEGIVIPRTVDTIYPAGKDVSTPQRGDIVFFETYKPGPSHAGIYLGNDEFLHASSSKGVIISKLSNPYYEARYLGAKRYIH